MIQAQPKFARYAGPLLIALAGLIMLSWSWGTWPDPLVDFGAQLYAPWQISTGHVLYRDVAYYSGPFSCYLNASAFRVFGVGLRTVVWLNLLLVAATIILAYRLTLRTSGAIAAALGGITFVLIFAFGQTVGVGNYNWLTPYTHEVCHGTTLGIAALACLCRFQHHGRTRWLIIAGILLGLVLLTKAEPTTAAFFAATALLISHWWMKPTPRKIIAQTIAILFGCAMIPPIIATGLLSLAMPVSKAIHGEIGSWPWPFDHRMASLHFYRQVAGLDDIPANLHTLLNWCGIYAIVISLGLAGAFMARTRQAGIAIASVFFVLFTAVIVWQFDAINWSGMLTPLPLCLIAVLILAAAKVLRRTDAAAPLQLALVIFAVVLVSKMGLTTKAFHYGFVLAWPGTVVLISMMAVHIPRWIDQRGGSGLVFRAVGTVAWMTAVWVLLGRDAQNFDSKKRVIAAGTTDQFRGNAPALEVQEVCTAIQKIVPPEGSVQVLPQGLMINYLTRRPSPTRYTNFMPPEVLTAGEQTILTALKNHPPSVVVLTTSSIHAGHFTMDGKDPYGADTLAWVMRNYQVVEEVELPPPLPTTYRFMIMQKR